MLAGHQIKNHLQRTGGTMLGDLDMVAQKIKFSNGDVSISVTPASSYLKILDLAGVANKHLWADTLNIQGNVLIAATKTVDGRDISELVRAKIKVGSYTGDGNDNRTINIGVDLTAKSNVHIWIGGNGAWNVAERPEIGQGDLTKIGAGAFAVNGVQALKSTGFEIGVNNSVNAAGGYAYWYVVFYEEP